MYKFGSSVPFGSCTLIRCVSIVYLPKRQQLLIIIRHHFVSPNKTAQLYALFAGRKNGGPLLFLSCQTFNDLIRAIRKMNRCTKWAEKFAVSRFLGCPAKEVGIWMTAFNNRKPCVEPRCFRRRSLLRGTIEVMVARCRWRFTNHSRCVVVLEGGFTLPISTGMVVAIAFGNYSSHGTEVAPRSTACGDGRVACRTRS